MELPSTQKRTHEAVHYEHPSGHGRERCAVCAHFISSNPPRCEGVQSPIRPEDWCKRFEHVAGKGLKELYG